MADAGPNAEAVCKIDFDLARPGIQTDITLHMTGQVIEAGIYFENVANLLGYSLDLKFDSSCITIEPYGNEYASERSLLPANPSQDQTIFISRLDGNVLNITNGKYSSNTGVTGSGYGAAIKLKILKAKKDILSVTTILLADTNPVFDDITAHAPTGFNIHTSFSMDNVLVYPNPYKPYDDTPHTGLPGEGIVFSNVPAKTALDIYDITGQHIFHTRIFLPDFTWDTTNSSGQKVSSGIYMYFLHGVNGSTKKGKIGIIR